MISLYRSTRDISIYDTNKFEVIFRNDIYWGGRTRAQTNGFYLGQHIEGVFYYQLLLVESWDALQNVLWQKMEGVGYQ